MLAPALPALAVEAEGGQGLSWEMAQQVVQLRVVLKQQEGELRAGGGGYGCA